MTTTNTKELPYLLSDAVLAKLQSNAVYTERHRGPEVLNPVSCALSMLSKSAGHPLNHRLGWAFFYSWDKENPTSLPAATVNAALLFCESLHESKSAESVTYQGEHPDAPPLVTDWDFMAMPSGLQRAVCREIMAAIIGSSDAFYTDFGLPKEFEAA